MTVKTILIAEDEPRFKETYRSWAQSSGYNVIEVSCLHEGLERLCEVDAVITDFGLKQGDGNELARSAKERHLPVAGISGGGGSVFDARYVDISESKTIDERNFRTLLGCLFEENPRDSYDRKARKEVNYILPAAASILLQGYYMVVALKQGLDEISCDGEVIVTREQMAGIRSMARDMRDQDPNKVFEMFSDGGLDARKVYDAACQNNPRLQNDSRLSDIFVRIGNGDYDLSINDAVYASRKILEGYD